MRNFGGKSKERSLTISQYDKQLPQETHLIEVARIFSAIFNDSTFERFERSILFFSNRIKISTFRETQSGYKFSTKQNVIQIYSLIFQLPCNQFIVF